MIAAVMLPGLVVALAAGLVAVDTLHARRFVVARKPGPAIAAPHPPETETMDILKEAASLGERLAALLLAAPSAIDAKIKAAVADAEARVAAAIVRAEKAEADVQGQIDAAVAAATGGLQAVITDLEDKVGKFEAAFAPAPDAPADPAAPPVADQVVDPATPAVPAASDAPNV